MAIQAAATKNALAEAYGDLGTYIALHTGSPGSDGTANHATGGSPAYARKATVWGTASGGVITGSEVEIDVPAGTYTHISIWLAATGTGSGFVDSAAITSTTLGAQGKLLITPAFTIS